jgi:hypothetical protein
MTWWVSGLHESGNDHPGLEGVSSNRLLQNLSSKVRFFCYHQRTDTLIYAERSTSRGVESFLFAQERDSSRPLPPVRPFSQCLETERRWLIKGKVSEDGRHICLEYETFGTSIEYAILCIQDERGSYDHHQNSWIYTKHILKDQYSRDYPTRPVFPFGFIGNDKIFTKDSLLDLRTNIRENRAANAVLSPIPKGHSQHVKSFILGNGGLIQYVRTSTIEGVQDLRREYPVQSSVDLNQALYVFPPSGGEAILRRMMRECIIVATSSDGRFVVWKARKPSTMQFGLHNVETGIEYILEPTLPHDRKFFEFWSSNQFLVCFYSSQESGIGVGMWDLRRLSGKTLQGHLTSKPAPNDELDLAYIHHSTDEAYLVTSSHIWTRFDLKSFQWKDTPVSFQSESERRPDLTSQREYTAAMLSADNRYLAMVSVKWGVWTAELLNLSQREGEIAHTFDSEEPTDDTHRPLTLYLEGLSFHASSNLRLMHVDNALFYRAGRTPGADLIALQVPDSLPMQCFLNFDFRGIHALSCCGQYLATFVHPTSEYFGEESDTTGTVGSGESGSLRLFRVKADSEELVELPNIDVPGGPNRVIRMAFHPSKSSLLVAAFSARNVVLGQWSWGLYSLDLNAWTFNLMASGSWPLLPDGVAPQLAEHSCPSATYSFSPPMFSEESIWVQCKYFFSLHGRVLTFPRSTEAGRRSLLPGREFHMDGAREDSDSRPPCIDQPRRHGPSDPFPSAARVLHQTTAFHGRSFLPLRLPHLHLRHRASEIRDLPRHPIPQRQ